MRKVAVVLYYDEINNEIYVVPVEPSNRSFLPDITLDELKGLNPTVSLKEYK